MPTPAQTKALNALPADTLRAFVSGLLTLHEQGDDEAIYATVNALADIDPAMWPMAIHGLIGMASAPVSPEQVAINHRRNGRA